MRESAGMRLAVLFGSFFILLLLSSILAIVINGAQAGSERTHLLIISASQCVLAFIIPALILAKYSSNNWASWLELTRLPSLKAFLGVIVMYAITLPGMEWLIEWNANLHLPPSMAGLENLMREWETNAESATSALLTSNGVWSAIAGVLVIGVLTGFSEEMFFRGGLQGIFMRTNLNRNVGVWMTAFIFSVMHFQFFGFVPRLLMGAFFGYLLIWSRSIWLPIFAHALNNSVVVIAAAMAGENTTRILDPDPTSYVSNSWGVVASVVLTIIFLWQGRDLFKDKRHLSWQKQQEIQPSES